MINFPEIAKWITSHLPKVFGIFLGAIFLNKFLKTFFKKIIRKSLQKRGGEEIKKRSETLTITLVGTLNFIIWIVAILMILPEFGINIAPILTSLGIGGLALGMAAKDIVSDFLAGLFILLEGQYFVGDKVKILGIEGEVIEITLRRTVIKDKEGNLHLIPNSQIKVVARKEK